MLLLQTLLCALPYWLQLILRLKWFLRFWRDPGLVSNLDSWSKWVTSLWPCFFLYPVPVVGFLLRDWRFTELNLAIKHLIKIFTHYWIFTHETPYQIFFRIFLALTLLTAVGCASTQKQEGSGEYVDDSVITSKVKAAYWKSLPWAPPRSTLKPSRALFN